MNFFLRELNVLLGELNVLLRDMNAFLREMSVFLRELNVFFEELGEPDVFRPGSFNHFPQFAGEAKIFQLDFVDSLRAFDREPCGFVLNLEGKTTAEFRIGDTVVLDDPFDQPEQAGSINAGSGFRFGNVREHFMKMLRYLLLQAEQAILGKWRLHFERTRTFTK